jgi:hypothetical protein
MLESFHNRKNDVVGTLRELLGLAERVGAKTLSARLGADLVQKLEADRFHLVVVGEFNHGKTTFVNALLGANILPVGVTPTTAVIHHLEYAAEPRAEVVYSNGERISLPFEQVRDFSVGHSKAPAHSLSPSRARRRARGPRSSTSRSATPPSCSRTASSSSTPQA